MWVSKLGCKIELEVIVVFDNTITDLKGCCVTLSYNLLLEKWLNSWIKFLTNVLNHYSNSLSDRGLKMLQVVGIGKFEDFDSKVGFLTHSLDPFVGLTLWIDIKWPSAGLIGDDSVFNREGI